MRGRTGQDAFDAVAMLRLVSRTFSLGIEQLPRGLRDPITIAYLMFRVSDFLEDNDEMDPERKSMLLELWASIMAGKVAARGLTQLLTSTDPDDPEARVARHADEVMHRLSSLPLAVRDFIVAECIESARGMARWQLRGPDVRDEADLDDYMFEVAGRVGLMLTRVFAWHAREIRERMDEMMPLAREFGLALQTVNIIRNMREDFARGWIFVPESFCAKAGIAREQLFDPQHVEEALLVVGMLADKAERHLRGGLEYVKMIPRKHHRIRLFCMWPLLFAVRTLAVSRDNSDVLESEVKISRAEVMRIVMQSQVWGWSNGWLDRYYESLRAA